MQIDIIGANTVKITLNKADMLCYDFRFDRVDCNSPQMKEFIVDMIDTVKDRKNIELDSKQLYIEAFPKNDGGCLIYISPIDEKPLNKGSSNFSFTDIVTEFSDIEAVIAISKILYKRYLCFINKSSLYKFQDKYRFVTSVYSKAESKVSKILGEYGLVFENSDYEYAATCEHYNILLNENAVKTLASL